ncbi:MAG TPA: 50S ribosomal protein L3 N(5)-glutamine methyltransferase [Stellaceae bacterium]|nr:50S ribosomal protein L3 N(5)-glutamine methyltransferase [Stellaceae bacterium]
MSVNGPVTVRDFLGHAVRRFAAAKLSYGHGTDNARDEAAFLILEGLRLPIDALDPVLDKKLTAAERERITELIDARIATRKPAAYLLRRAYVGGLPFYVDERAIVPRSFIAELLRGPLLAALVGDPAKIRRVLDLCTGSGCLAVLAAHAFPKAHIDATELSADALDVARRNVEESGLAPRIRLFEGDLFAPVAGERYDLVLANPPYVDARAMAALPAEYRHEPALALAGGTDGLALIRRILAEAPAHLTERGGLLCEVGRGKPRLEAAFSLPFLWLDTAASIGEVFWLDAKSLRPL